MTTATAKRQSSNAAAARDHHDHSAGIAGPVSVAMTFARTRARGLIERLPETMDATVAGANDTTSELQRLPDSTLRLLAAGSIGLGVGFYLAGAPRLIVAAGLVPALVMGAAIALRPVAPWQSPTSTPTIRLEELPT
jgi:hypothetical protein